MQQLDPQAMAVDTMAGLLLQRSRSLLREREHIQSRIQAALAKFRPSDAGRGQGLTFGMKATAGSPTTSPRFDTGHGQVSRLPYFKHYLGEGAGVDDSESSCSSEAQTPRPGGGSAGQGQTAVVPLTKQTTTMSHIDKHGQGDLQGTWRDRLVSCPVSL